MENLSSNIAILAWARPNAANLRDTPVLSLPYVFRVVTTGTPPYTYVCYFLRRFSWPRLFLRYSWRSLVNRRSGLYRTRCCAQQPNWPGSSSLQTFAVFFSQALKIQSVVNDIHCCRRKPAIEFHFYRIDQGRRLFPWLACRLLVPRRLGCAR